MKIFQSLMSLYLVFWIVSHVNATSTETKVNFITINSQKDWDAIKNDAAELGKSIFVDVYTDWCGYCKMMDRDVFNDQEVGKYLNGKFISVKLDAETDFGEKFSAQNSVTGFPTYLFFDISANKIGVINGYHKKDAFLEQAKTIEEKVDELPLLEEKFQQKTLSKEEMAKYALLLRDSNLSKSEEVAQLLLRKLDENDYLNDVFLDFLSVYALNVDSDFFNFINSNKNSFVEKLGNRGIETYLGNLYNDLLSKAIMTENKGNVEIVVNKVLPLYVENDNELPQARYVTWKMYYANLADIENYESIVEKEYEEIGKEDTEFWYAQAYEIVQQYSSMGDFVEVAITWIDKSLTIKEDYETYALYAYALGMKGDFTDAKEKATKAKSMARDSEQQEMANELIEMIDNASQGD